MVKQILKSKGVIIFYGLIIFSIIGLNARLAALNEVEVKNEIAISQNMMTIKE